MHCGLYGAFLRTHASSSLRTHHRHPRARGDPLSRLRTQDSGLKTQVPHHRHPRARGDPLSRLRTQDSGPSPSSSPRTRGSTLCLSPVSFSPHRRHEIRKSLPVRSSPVLSFWTPTFVGMTHGVDSRFHGNDNQRRTQDAGRRTQDAGRRTQDAGLRTQDSGLRPSFHRTNTQLGGGQGCVLHTGACIARSGPIECCWYSGSRSCFHIEPSHSGFSKRA